MARKAMLVCGTVALLGGGVAGLGLANYAQSGAFEFYKNTPPPGMNSDVVATADSAGYYPISRAAATPAYPENPYPPQLTIARPAEPVDYRPVAAVEAPPPMEEQAALPEPAPAPEPVVAPQRGSWTAPEPETAAEPEETTPGDTAS